MLEHYFQTDDCLNLTFFNPQRLKTAMTPTIDLNVMAHLPEKQNLDNLASEKLLSSVPPLTHWPHTRPGISRLWAISIIIPVTSKELLLSQTLHLYFNNSSHLTCRRLQNHTVSHPLHLLQRMQLKSVALFTRWILKLFYFG